MKILLTGATGFIGRHLTSALLEERNNVAVLIRNNDEGFDLAGAETYIYDGSYMSIDRAVGDFAPELAIHLATCYLASHEASDIDRLMDANVRFGAMLLEALAKNNCLHFINAGTRWQHKDNQPYRPVNLYAATKQAFQAILEFYVDSSPMRALTLELCDTFGPGDRRRKIIDVLVSSALKGEPTELSGGAQLLDVLYVDDVVGAFLCAVQRVFELPAHISVSYSVSSGNALSLRGIGEIIERETGTRDLFLWGRRPYRPREAMVPCRFFEELPGWAPEKTLEERLSHYIKTFNGS